MTVQPNEITEVLNRPLSQELLACDLTRLAYVAKDGTPRNVPIGFTWNGAEIVMCTSKNAPKLPALRKNPMVALTIDTEVHPPRSYSSAVGPSWTSSMASRMSISR
jgi:nitroimidazol reductase NimA-like FMN-containing flavoprotein (pyridoxamine 5'-phosphate oxidase superfamily)